MLNCTQKMATIGNILSRNKLPCYISSVYCNINYTKTVESRSYCSKEQKEAICFMDTDPAPYFLNKDVQRLLKTLTRPNYKKIFRKKLDGRNLEEPIYKFMTDKQLEQTQLKTEYTAQKFLQMPPIVKVKSEINEVLSKDPALQGFDTSKYIFTDITYGIKEADRFIVVRESDGTLRSAYNDERKRMNQIYLSYPGREIIPPKMFFGEYLQDLLNRNEYEFILNRACIQYDPNEAEWHRITQTVYDHINKGKNFDQLRSTRHYGPMVFYLTWNKNIDNLLLENLKTNKIEDAVLLVQLYHILHTDCKSAKLKNATKDIEFILNYVEHDSPNKGKLELAVKMFKELEAEKEKLATNIQKAHGVE